MRHLRRIPELERPDMTMQNPLDLTQTDLRGLMEGVQTVANIPGVGGGSSPLGGVSELLDTAERFFNLFDRFNVGVNQFSTTITKLRGAEGLGIDQPAQGGFFPAGQVIDADPVYRPPVTTPTPEPEPEPEPVPTPTIAPIKIYAKALGWLAELPGEMTMKEALELARSNKGMILGAIENELPNLLGVDDGPGE
jgi:hypothetical protein